MISQLHERLDHLVHYSSQLIFVSGKTVAEQQRHLEQFLSQQYDDTEIAYLQLNEALRDDEIRQEICMQLQIDPQQAYKRPLNELLHELNDYPGPVLVCITQAHLMSQQLLNELWDLVLQSRFANNKQHLNVILFAEPKWAYAAQQAVPSRNSDQPLLFSSERLVSENEQDVESFLAHHKQRFAEHLSAHRKKQRQSPRSKVWLYCVLSVLIIIFSVLVASRFYPEILDVKTLKSAITLPASKPQQEAPTIRYITPSEYALGQMWQNLAPISSQQKPMRIMHFSPLLPKGMQTEPRALVKSTVEQKTIIQTPVENIVKAPQNQHPLSAKIQRDSQQILALPMDSWVLQLVGMKDLDAIASYIDTFALADQSWLYETQKFGGPWYVLLLNIDFVSRQDAFGNVNSLPPEIIAAGPFAKSSLAIQSELLITDDNN